MDDQVDAVYTVHLHPQQDLERVGIGASAQVYQVDDQIVLKASWLFEHPGSTASQNDQWHYASDTLFQANLLQNERFVLRLLQHQPHPHIIEALDTSQPEGIYLRRYASFPDELPAQSYRIRWYRDLTDALCHLHSLGVAHADIRIENILFDRDRATLCDFSAACPFGEANAVFPDPPLPINGPSAVMCEATDMFAMASLIFQIEHQCKPELSLDASGNLALPRIQTGHPALDAVIRTSWLGGYQYTTEMLEGLNSLGTCSLDIQASESTEGLRPQIKNWREDRVKKFGKDSTH